MLRMQLEVDKSVIQIASLALDDDERPNAPSSTTSASSATASTTTSESDTERSDIAANALCALYNCLAGSPAPSASTLWRPLPLVPRALSRHVV